MVMPGPLGSFSGEVVARWCHEGDDARHMELVEDFHYMDPAGRLWTAPAGSKVNGASIPRFLWRAVGCPYTGPYRRASVIHDVYCETGTRPSWLVHRTFYWMCRRDGCSPLWAFLLWLAVRLMGPHFPGKGAGQ